jgi:hypothetical protein
LLFQLIAPFLKVQSWSSIPRSGPMKT